MIRFSVVAFVATATVVGCAGEADEHRGVVVRDSAGIRIVENEGASWTSDQAWRLSQEPIAEIGRLDEPAHQPDTILEQDHHSIEHRSCFGCRNRAI